MSKSCINCKYFYAGKCNNNEVNSNIEIDVKQGHEYSEEGVLVETLREAFSFKDLVELISDELKANDMLKKKYDYNKIEFKYDAESRLYEMIDNALYNSLSNYFDGIRRGSIEIKEPREFYCNRWE